MNLKINSAILTILFIVVAINRNMLAQVSTSQFKGVNWADTRDNFQSGVLYLSGLSSTDTYASASVVADKVIGQFVSKLGSNSVRLPINVATVSNYWNTYTGAIDVALTKGKVVLCYWSSSSGAKPADMTAFWAMWKKVVDKYGSNPNCYFEVFNEPSGYSKTDLLNLYDTWLKNYPIVPQNHIILDGSGLAMNVPDVGADPRFSNCLLAVHDYSFFASFPTEQQWSNHLKSFVGAYAQRTVMTEFGAPMTAGTKDGVNYGVQDYNSPPGTNFVAYLRGITSQLRAWNMGSFYWPGLRDNDWYSLTTKTGTGANITLTINNQSGLDRVHYAWGGTAEARGPYNGIPHPIPGTIQMEEFDKGGNGVAYLDDSPGSEVVPVVNFRTDTDVDIQTCTDAGGGYNVGYANAGEWLEYTVDVAKAGSYDVDFRVACNGTGRTVSLAMDGVALGNAVSVPNTGGWQTWADVSVKALELKSGQQVLRLTIGSTDNVNLNYMVFKPSLLTGLESPEAADMQVFPVPFQADGLEIRKPGDFIYRIQDMSGRQLEEGKAADVKRVGGGLTPGTYILTIETKTVLFRQKIVRQ